MRNTIKNHKDFLPHDTDPVVKMPIFILRVTPTRFKGDARYGLITAKKIFKPAVERNRARRLLRAWLRECGDEILNPDYDYIFIARTDILKATRDEGVAMMKKAIRKCDVLLSSL